MDVFATVIADLQKLHGIQARALACDAHPGYASTRWAAEQGLPLIRVQHHRAHASALVPTIDGWSPRFVSAPPSHRYAVAPLRTANHSSAMRVEPG